MSTPPPLSVARARCRNHADREAVARCPECGSFFCRECISEHDGRMMCTHCIRLRLAPGETKKNRQLLRRGLLWCAALGGVFIAWSFFVLLGRLLLLLNDLKGALEL